MSDWGTSLGPAASSSAEAGAGGRGSIATNKGASAAPSATAAGDGAPEEEEQLRGVADDSCQGGGHGADQRVAALHVAELVGQHRLDVAPVHRLEQAGGHRDRGVLGVAAGGEGVGGVDGN